MATSERSGRLATGRCQAYIRGSECPPPKLTNHFDVFDDLDTWLAEKAISPAPPIRHAACVDPPACQRPSSAVASGRIFCTAWWRSTWTLLRRRPRVTPRRAQLGTARPWRSCAERLKGQEGVDWSERKNSLAPGPCVRSSWRCTPECSCHGTCNGNAILCQWARHATPVRGARGRVGGVVLLVHQPAVESRWCSPGRYPASCSLAAARSTFSTSVEQRPRVRRQVGSGSEDRDH